MSITVYWTSTEKNWVEAQEPESVYKQYINTKGMFNSGIDKCPATFDYLKNMYSIKSLFDFKFTINDEKINILNMPEDANFIDNNFIVRSAKNKLFSIQQRFLFFTEDDSLLMSAGLHPFLENNDIAKNCVVTPGSFDIGKWFRVTDFAFYLKDGCNDFNIEYGDVMFYVNFHTTEKIKFKQFMPTPRILKFVNDIDFAKSNTIIKRMKKLSEFYVMQKHKKLILKEIKENLI